MDPASRSRYLRLLGVPPRAPGRDALFELVSAHLQHVPFENVSKLLRLRQQGLRGVPGLDTFLDGIEHHHLGGTCYANNHHLHQLLVALGYDADLCGADMSEPDVHAVVLVRLEGREYLVDGGYGAPFLEPLPRDLPHELEIVQGRERYVLGPRDQHGRSRLDLYRDGTLRHGYLAKPTPRRIEDFAAVVAASFAPSATFMNRVTFMRFRPGRSLVLQNLNLLAFAGRRSREERIAPADLPAVIERWFEVPAAVTRAAIGDLLVPDGPWE